MLLQKGLRQANKDHKLYVFYQGERKTAIFTKISHGDMDYGDQLLAAVARRLKVNKGHLRDLVECNLTEEAYRRLLLENGHIVEPG